MCYKIKRLGGKFTPVTPLYVANAFGSETLDAKKPAELCVDP